MNKKGIDISSWQKGLTIQQVKNAGYDFAIIRGGVTGYGAARTKNKDGCFEQFYGEAKQIGFPIGAYYYSCAKTKQEGIDEAKFLYETALKGKQFEYPIYIDVENSVWQANNKTGVTDAIIGFCETLENLGYFVGVYANLNWFRNHIETNRLNAYTKWLACWSSAKPNFPWNAFDLWQNSNNGNIAGKRVDTDFCFRDFPAEIKARGLNGFPKSGSDTPKEPENPKKTVDELANEVIRGEWGNGEERRKRLTEAGYDYAAVQNRVNELAGKKPVEKPSDKIKVGDTVTVTDPIIYGTNKKFKEYYKKYTVMELNGSRAVIGVKGVVTAAINVKYLRKA